MNNSSDLCEFEINHLAHANYAWQNKCHKQQLRITNLEMNLRFVKDHFVMNDLDKAMPRVFEEIEQVLGGKEISHNTSCTYQFELAFLNLQDTPELRKLYWSAMGECQFDENDKIVVPELVECPVCMVSE